MSQTAQHSAYLASYRAADINVLGRHVESLRTLDPQFESCSANQYYSPEGRVDMPALVPNCNLGRDPNDRYASDALLQGGHPMGGASLAPAGLLRGGDDQRALMQTYL